VAKEYEILGIDAARGCMLVRFTDAPKQHETEIPLPPHLSATPTPAEIADWVRRFWPHSQMEAQAAVAGLTAAGAVGKIVDITADVPTPADSVDGPLPPTGSPD
jgi:hypothetical protein